MVFSYNSERSSPARSAGAKRALTARRVRIENSDQLHIHSTDFFGVSKSDQ